MTAQSGLGALEVALRAREGDDRPRSAQADRCSP